MKKPYRYTECGLDYVYLVDGFEVIETAHGRAVQVSNAGKLDKAIALAVVRHQARLTGQELRFLRGLLDMTQEELGRALGKDAQTVARWENGKTELPSTEDIAIRQIYLEETGHRQRFIETSRKVGDLKECVEKVRFQTKGQAWSMAAMRREAKRSKTSKGRGKSLADMFPVTKSDPPVEPLKLSRRPGFRRIAGLS